MLYTNKYKLPDEVASALTADNYDYTPDPKTISATSLLKHPKERLLSLRHKAELKSDVMDNLWRLFGSACHSIFEKQETEGIPETRLRYHSNFFGMTVTGKSDLYLPAKKLIRDYKVTSVWKIIYNDDKSWEQQLNIYAYLHRCNGFEVNELEVVAILRDFSQREANKKPDYPQQPIAVITLPLWDIKEQEKFITSRLELHSKYLQAADDDIPHCSANDRWATADTYAIYIGENKKALRVFNTSNDAMFFMHNYETQYKVKLRLEVRTGENKKCDTYCEAAVFCHFYRQLKSNQGGI